jgi:hypothetical protein
MKKVEVEKLKPILDDWGDAKPHPRSCSQCQFLKLNGWIPLCLKQKGEIPENTDVLRTFMGLEDLTCCYWSQVSWWQRTGKWLLCFLPLPAGGVLLGLGVTVLKPLLLGHVGWVVAMVLGSVALLVSGMILLCIATDNMAIRKYGAICTRVD